MHRVRMLKHFGVTPYLVFDGDYLPSKAGTEASRAKRREDSKKAGLELLKAGKPSQAHLELQKAIDVTPEMARHLIEELKKNGVPYVVAPYEADAQMVYLERQGVISGIISEDSDLLVFGCKRLLTKLDQHGQCIEINRNDFCRVREISLTGWTDVEFRHMAIFSGCDYLDSVSNMGLKTAYRMIRKHKTPEKVIRMLQFDGKFRVSENYLAAFKQAELTFLHQRVFCPTKQELVFLTDPDPRLDVENMPFIGSAVDPQTARLVAAGDINPMTKEPIIIEPLPGRSPKRRASSSVSATGMTGKPFGKPIESYFKGPRRIPLGEMDPNCFVVEPGQVAGLTQSGLLPRVFPLPRPYIDSPAPPARPYTTTPRLRRRQTEPLHSLLGLPPPKPADDARRRTAGPELIGQNVPSSDGHQMRPPKKARLCEDAPSMEEDLPAEKSKFFSATKPQTKPADTILFSDDSIEEALRELPDIDNSWSRRKSLQSMPRKSLPSEPLQIFDDRVQKGKHLVAEGDRTTSDDIISESDVEVPASSPFLASEETEQVQHLASETPIRPTLQQFSYTPQPPGLPSSSSTLTSHGQLTPRDTPRAPAQPPSAGPAFRKPSSARISNGLPTPASSLRKPAPTPTSTRSSSSSSCSSSAATLLTPLQRIGAQALNRAKPPGTFTPPLTPRSSSIPSNKKDENRRKSYDAMPVNPAFVPLPKVDADEVEELGRAAVGSEDLIVPGESEGENDDDDGDGVKQGEERRRGGGGRLGLARFLYG